MMEDTTVAIIGGGLAGLTAAIHLSKNGISTTVFEKENFPNHKVCGEYVSKEILPYFEQLDIPLEKTGAVDISRLKFSTHTGNSLEVSLPLGGLGLSRYAFDNFLYRKALENGAKVLKSTVKNIAFKNDTFEIFSSDKKKFSAKIVLGAFGKRSGLDKVFEREFFKKPAPWLAIKSHFREDSFPSDLVALHNFRGGYCGLSKTETGAINVCYLTKYESFKEFKDPELFGEKVLRKNPFLDSFFSEAKPIFDAPISIAQVSFSKKKAVEEHILMLGDAAGLLHPLCGNGMAMAIHSAKISSEIIIAQVKNGIFDRKKMEEDYATQWNFNFKNRIRTGRLLQKVLLNENLSEISQAVISKLPFLMPAIIKSTHGKPIL